MWEAAVYILAKSIQCYRCRFELNWIAPSSGHMDDTTQAVWRLVMFFMFEYMPTVGFHCIGTGHWALSEWM